MPANPLRLPALTLILGLVFVAVIAVFVVTRTNRDDRVVKSSGLELTASQAHGRQLFAGRCATCHTLAAVDAVGKVGPNLDILAPNGLDQSFVEDTIRTGVVRGNGTMPAGIYTDQDATDVASFLSAVTRDEAAARAARVVTNLERETPSR